MTLGFTVEALVPAGRGGGALRMGLSRVPEADWLWPSVDRAARARAFAAHPEAVVLAPGAEAAASEAAALIGGTGDFGEAARGCWEDLCVLERRGGAHVLTAGAVAFPTDWRLADKIGLPIAEVHAPIHGYAEQLAAGVNHVLETLAAGPIFGRANWFVVASDDWRYMPKDDPAERFAHVDAANAGRTLFVRCERQTLRRLPDTGAVLFTIGVAVSRLDTLSATVMRRVADGIAAQSAGEQDRRAVPFYAAALAGYAAGLDERAAA